MTDNVIQQQIKVISFKAISVEFNYFNTIAKAIFNLRLDDILISNNPKMFAKAFYIDLIASIGNDHVKSKIEYHVLFESATIITEDFLQTDFVKISAPAIGFPYVRAFVSTLSVQAGLPAIILPSINFVQFSKQQDALLKA